MNKRSSWMWIANVLELDDHGDPVNEKPAERRAATWLYRYCTGEQRHHLP